MYYFSCFSFINFVHAYLHYFCSKPDPLLFEHIQEVPWDAPLQEAFTGSLSEDPALSVNTYFTPVYDWL